jgi:hypothetical protein
MSQVPLYWHYLSHSHVLVDIGASRGCCPRGVVFFMSEVPLYRDYLSHLHVLGAIGASRGCWCWRG